MQTNQNELVSLFKEWQSGRITDFSNVKPVVSLQTVKDWYVIVSFMPEDNIPTITTLAENEKGKAKVSLHAFIQIGTWLLPGNKGTATGPLWNYGPGLWDAFPFPHKDLAEEFASKVIDLPGVEIWTVGELLDYINGYSKPK